MEKVLPWVPADLEPGPGAPTDIAEDPLPLTGAMSFLFLTSKKGVIQTLSIFQTCWEDWELFFVDKILKIFFFLIKGWC